MDGVIDMASVSLNVTNYLVDGHLPADTVCEWIDGLDVTVGHSRNNFGDAMTDFHGSRADLNTLIFRFEDDPEMAHELAEEIVGA